MGRNMMLSKNSATACMHAGTASYRPVPRQTAHHRPCQQLSCLPGSEITSISATSIPNISNSTNPRVHSHSRPAQPDFSFPVPGTQATVHVFGCEHCEPQPHIGKDPGVHDPGPAFLFTKLARVSHAHIMFECRTHVVSARSGHAHCRSGGTFGDFRMRCLSIQNVP